MALEDPTYISDLVQTNPDGLDLKKFGDEHIRRLKKAIQNTFPNIAGEVLASHAELNNITEGTTAGRAAMGLDYKAKNLLVNPSMIINQRNSPDSGTVAAGTYIRDMWFADTSVTYNIPANTNNINICTVSVGTVRTVVPASKLTGEALTLSWAGNAVASVNGSIPAASPISIAATASPSDLFIDFTAGQFYKPQLEKGTKATEYAYVDPALDLYQCKRKYQTGVLRAALGANNMYAGLSQMLPVQMEVPLPIATFTDNLGNASRVTSNGVHNFATTSGTLTASSTYVIFDVLTALPMTNWWAIQYTLEG